MDTKLKNTSWSSRKSTCLISGAVAAIAATVVTFVGAALVKFYEMGYGTVYDDRGVMYWIEADKIAKRDGLLASIEAATGKLWLILAIAAVIALIFIIAGFCLTGGKESDDRIHLNWFDRWFAEFQLILGGSAVGGVIGLTFALYIFASQMEIYREVADAVLSSVNPEPVGYDSIDFISFGAVVILCAAGLIICYGVIVLCLNSMVKKIKARTFWKHTILGALIYALWNSFKGSDKVTAKVMTLCVGACLLSASWIGTVPVIVLICIFVPGWMKKYKAVKTGVDQIRKGNLDYQIEVNGTGELDRLAESVNEIREATKIAVENENKSTRMKTDLISNVSHDIKTPLTSMITYVDLLKREGLDSENAPEYLRIVDEKTQRLKKLTEDLFEAAKASSGAMPVDIQKIELVSMINQAMVETEERFEARNLNVIYTNKADSIHVLADGQLLWRVLENLFVNAGKYALTGSRVYVDLVEKDDYLTIEVKNISEAQLNITAEELMERFQRGDASRNTEGSGLGLSIAKDLTELMNGIFEISVDGDLFKASVTLEKAE